MKVDAKSLLEKLKAEKKPPRVKTSLFLAKDIYEDFKEICEREDMPASAVIEQLMNDFIFSYKKTRSKK